MGPDFLSLVPFTIGLIARKGTMQLKDLDLMPFYISDVHDMLLGVFGFRPTIIEFSLAFFLSECLLDTDH